MKELLKGLWAKRYFKTIVVTAAGGAAGAIEPMIAAGTFVFNHANIHTALVGAAAAVSALFIHKPVAPVEQGPGFDGTGTER